MLTESDSLEEYIEWSNIPAEYGGQSSHDQLEWVQFYKVRRKFLDYRVLIGGLMKKIHLLKRSCTLYFELCNSNWIINFEVKSEYS